MFWDNINKKFKNLPFDPVYLLMIFSLIFRMINFMGIAQGDDFPYSSLANRFANGNFTANFIFDVRWVVFAPAALLYKIFGINDYTSLIPTFVYSVSSVWFAYKIVEAETDRATAVITTLFYTTYPIVVIFANFLQVAAPLEFFTLLTVYSFQRGAKTEKTGWFILGGFAIGWIFFARTTGLFIALLVSIYVWYKKGFNKKTILWVGCAALVSLVPAIFQGLVYLKVHNNFFHVFDLSKKVVEYQNRMTDVDPKDLFFYIRTVFTSGNFARWRTFGFGGYFTAIALLACIVKMCLKKQGKEVLFFIWFLSYFLFMSFAPTSLSPYTTLIRNNRYTIIFVLPLCTICAILLTDLAKTGKKTVAVLASALFLTIFISNIYYSLDNSAFYKRVRGEQKESMSVLLSNYPDTTIYLADRNIDYRINYYSGYTNRNYKFITSLKQIKKPGVFLILHKMNSSASRFKISREELAKIRRKPPKGMTLKHKTPYFNIYEVDPEVLKQNPDLK
jgi:hypothetical protein